MHYKYFNKKRQKKGYPDSWWIRQLVLLGVQYTLSNIHAMFSKDSHDIVAGSGGGVLAPRFQGFPHHEQPVMPIKAVQSQEFPTI